MRKQFEKLDVECWEHRGGRLGLRRPYICLQAAQEACDRLLAAVNELAAEDAPSKRTLTTKNCRRSHACTKIRLLLAAPSDALEEMSFTIERGTAVLEFTPAGLKAFQDAVLTWRNGGEDFSVQPSRKARGQKDKRSGEVWFWTPNTDP